MCVGGFSFLCLRIQAHLLSVLKFDLTLIWFMFYDQATLAFLVGLGRAGSVLDQPSNHTTIELLIPYVEMDG